jgi:hypothetical protein
MGPRGQSARLGNSTTWTSPADRLDVRPPLPRELERLCIVAGGHKDRVALLFECDTDWGEQQRMR